MFRHHNCIDISAGPQQTDSSDQVLLFALFEKAAAGIRIAQLQGCENLLQGNVIGLHLGHVEIDLVLLDETSKAHHISQAWDHL